MAKNEKIRFLKDPALRWLLEAAKGNKRYTLLNTVLQALVGLGTICYSLLFRELIDRAVAKDTPGFWLFLGALAALALVRIGVRAVIRYVDELLCARLENALKKRLFGTLLDREFAGVTAVHTGEWMNRLTSDTQVAAKGLAQIIPQLGGQLVQMTGALCAIVWMQPLFGSLLIPAGLALMVLTRVLRPGLKRLHRRIQETDGAVRVLLQERLDNLLIVDAYSQRDSSLEMAQQRMQTHKKARMQRNFLSNVSTVGLGVAMQGMYLAGAGFCAYGILRGTVSYGTMTAVLQMIGYLQTPLSGIGGYFTQWFAMLASAERLMEAEGLPRDVDGEAVDPAGSLALYQADFTGIQLRDLVFSYVDRTSGRELAVTIPYENQFFRKGEFLALAGRSGCGKSTLLKLLMCLYSPDSGQRCLVTRDGQRPLTASDRGLFAYVPQGNMLMSGTIRQIVSFYDREAGCREMELRQALDIACALEFVDALPQGLDTQLGEHGSGLSEGQIQRIALARAIFSRRPILLLDEATSALDEVTEARVLENLKHKTDRTVLIITHRPRACEICDRVIQMDKHLQEGSHDGR